MMKNPLQDITAFAPSSFFIPGRAGYGKNICRISDVQNVHRAKLADYCLGREK